MNLCPCTSLQKGVKILAIIDLVSSALSFGLGVFFLVALFAVPADELDLDHDQKTVYIVAMAILLILCVGEILLAVMLFRGAKKNNYKSCRVWFLVTIGIVILSIISIIVNSSLGKFEGGSFASGLIHILYKIYEILVVYSFTQTLSHTGELRV
ncbi:Major facilitator superfamily domain-containing protein 6 [Orchesella cincta]|uniref:Major facilitator superfamily domain-containing protein 6 n=1 Tax=Orchesella cincta TaxID=48709 RepID=A0A1D2M4Y0_ORCCI|nr:Major facilitator superfamily domain-containing protein 6 [Orchesella cincta]